MNADAQKRAAAARAVEFVRPGMRLGLGTGSTAKHFVELIGERVRAGLDVVAVPTSRATQADAERCSIKLTTLDETPELDLTVDGADEIAPDLSLIKGGGGALLREKVLAQASRCNIIIVDESKLASRLGTKWALPVEVVPFARAAEERFITSIGAAVTLRAKDGRPVATDQGNLLLDAAFGPMENPAGIAEQLNGRAGIVEHGLFLGLAHDVIVAGNDGIRHLKRRA